MSVVSVYAVFADAEEAERIGRTVVEEWGGPIDNGFQFQVAEMARCVADGRQESERMTWASSRAVMAVMDEARRQVEVDVERAQARLDAGEVRRGLRREMVRDQRSSRDGSRVRLP